MGSLYTLKIKKVDSNWMVQGTYCLKSKRSDNVYRPKKMLGGEWELEEGKRPK